MYKMIIVDLDGTLLNDYKEVSKENINLMKRAYEEKGIISVIATGRPLGYASEICTLYNNCFGNYIIASNGAIIKDIKNNEYINKITLTNREILSLRDIYLEEQADYIILCTEERSITETKYQETVDWGTNLNKEKAKIENIEEILKENPNTTGVLCIMGGDISVLEKILKRIEILENVQTSVICNYTYKSKNYIINQKYIDVTKKGCTKKNAIHILADKLGIKQEEIIVMGDGGNDISMFECAGLKIAMGNAEEYLKEKADYITETNNNDGVAKAIKKFIFDEN